MPRPIELTIMKGLEVTEAVRWGGKWVGDGKSQALVAGECW